MELVTLNANNQPQQLVENYDSLIWTERFNTVGDFQLTAGDVGGFMSMLPPGQLISIRESNITMVVETHQINRKKNTPEEIIITGRSFESILDRRVVVSNVVAAVSDWLINAKTPSDVAFYIINQICVLGILDVNDIFPTTVVQFVTPVDYGSTTGPIKTFSIPKGNLLSTVLGLLQISAKEDVSTTPNTPTVVQHGIRAVRPNSAGTAVGIEIYTGVDRASTVYFDATRDLLDDGTYLLTKLGSATTAYIIGPSSAAKLNKTAIAPSGFNRRVILVDGTTADTQLQEGEQSLAEAHETVIFDGSINQDLNVYKYNVDYHLGDTVKLVGDYNLFEAAVVTEYIRSEDATGTKSYPTLSIVTDYIPPAPTSPPTDTSINGGSPDTIFVSDFDGGTSSTTVDPGFDGGSP